MINKLAPHRNVFVSREHVEDVRKQILGEAIDMINKLVDFVNDMNRPSPADDMVMVSRSEHQRMTDDLPKSVRVGYRTYQIVPMTPKESSGTNHYGECSVVECLIRVATCYTRTESSNTLLHEILHAVWDAHTLAAGDGQERYVSAFANGLCQVMLDNPDVFAWIQAGLKADQAQPIAPELRSTTLL